MKRLGVVKTGGFLIPLLLNPGWLPPAQAQKNSGTPPAASRDSSPRAVKSSGMENDRNQPFARMSTLSSIACVNTSSALEEERLTVTMQMEHLKGPLAPCVRLTLEDGKPYLFVLELGITGSLLDRSVAQKSKLTIQSDKDENGTVVEVLRSAIRPAANSTILPKDTPFPPVQIPFIVSDLSGTRAAYFDYAGNLGINVLAQIAWKFDFGKQQVTFFLPGNLPGTPQEPKGIARIPLKQENGVLMVEGTIDDKPTRFMLVSIDATQLHAPDTLAGLKPVGRLKHTDNEAGTVAEESEARLREIKIGSFVWKSPKVSLGASRDKEQPNVLGMDFLSRFHVTVDMLSHSLYLEPDPAYKEPGDGSVGLGFTVNLNADKDLVISMVNLPSPASEAGLKVGDVITAVNGTVVRTTPIEQVSALVRNKPEGTEIRLTVQHKGETKTQEVKLKIRKLL